MNFVIYFISAFLLSFSVNAGLIFLFIKKKERNNQIKKWHRLGGVGIISAFFLGLFFNPELVFTKQISVLAFSTILILGFGILDDFYNFSWRKQIIFQIFLVALLILFDYNISHIATLDGINSVRFDWFVWNGIAWLSAGFILVWVLLMINAVGWSDGIDGLSGTIALFGALTLFVLSLTKVVNQPAMAILAVVFGGAILGFLVFNWPQGKIEAGTSGSYFLGFFLATTAIMAGTKIATIIVVLAIPVVDFFWVIGERFWEGRSIFIRDDNQRHLHYKLRKLGWSDRQIVLGYAGFILFALSSYLLMEERSAKIGVLGIELLLVVFFVYIITQKVSRR